jgi:dihydrofolate reductase
MGRRTYDVFAPVWPTRSGDPYSDHINTMRKYVVSTTLKDPDWADTEVIDTDVAERLAALKESPGENIVQYGFGPVSRLLLENHLLDELQLWVHPLILGRAEPGELMFGDAPTVGLDPADVMTLTDGTVIVTYRPRQAEAVAA